MSEPKTTEEGSSTRMMVLKVFLALGLMGGFVALLMMLLKGHQDGHNAISSYIDTVREGAPVTEAIAGAEAAELTRVLRESESFNVGNFQAQSDTSCFWVTLHGKSGGESELRVVLADHGKPIVSALSLKRSCDCPDDAAKPCHLVDAP